MTGFRFCHEETRLEQFLHPTLRMRREGWGTRPSLLHHWCDMAFLATQLLAGELCPLHSSADFLECSVSGSRSIVGEWRETAVVGSS